MELLAFKKESLILTIICFILTMMISYFYTGVSSGDDTYIYMRYVKQVLSGNGFAYNMGEESHGLTSFLWPLIMAPIAKAFGNTIWVWKITSSLFFSLGVSLISFIIVYSSKSFWRFPLIATLIISPHTLRWSGTGMENGLTVFLFCLFIFFWIFILYMKSCSKSILLLFGVITGLLPFARPELGIITIFSGLLFLYANLNDKKNALTFICGLSLSGIIMLASSYHFLGAIIPQTAEAKALSLKQPDSFYALKQTLAILVSGSFGALIVTSLLGLKYKIINKLIIVILLSIGISIFYLGISNHLVSTRYAVYITFPVVVISTIVGSVILKESNISYYRLKVLSLSIITQIGLSIFTLVYLYPATRTSESKDIEPIAAYVKNNTTKEARVALSEIGAFGFYSDRYIIDLVGLVDRKTLAYYQKLGKKEAIQLEDVLIERNATHYIDTFATGKPLEGNDKLRFTLVKEYYVSRNNLSKGKVVPDLWRLYKLEKI